MDKLLIKCPGNWVRLNYIAWAVPMYRVLCSDPNNYHLEVYDPLLGDEGLVVKVMDDDRIVVLDQQGRLVSWPQRVEAWDIEAKEHGWLSTVEIIA